MKEDKIRGNDIYWSSHNGNVAVTYNKFGFGSRYSVYRKSLIEVAPEKAISVWRYIISFTFLGEAIEYAKQIVDIALVFDDDE